MPGTWLSDTFGRTSDSPTGTSPTQPKPTLADQSWSPGPTTSGPNPWGNMTTATAGGSGYTAPQTAREQYPMLYGINSQGVVGTPTQPVNPLAGAQSIADTMYGPQTQILADQLARQQQTLGMIGMDADYKADALTRSTDLQMQGLGLDRQALGIDRNLTNTQLANLGRLRTLLGEQYGLNDATLANALKGFGIDKTEAADMARRKRFDLRSQLTARGAFNTVANERGTGRINRDLMYQLGRVGVGEQGARLQHQGSRIGLDEKGIGYDNTAAGLNARLGNLGLDEQRIGISEQQLANGLEDGLHQIGLDSMLSLNGLLDAIGGTNIQQAQLAGTILNEVLAYANLPPETLAAIQKALGIGASKPTDVKVPGQGML